MATVQEARAKVTDSILHTGTQTFSNTKLDRAIIAACNRFLRETRMVRKSSSLSITSGTITYDLDTLATGGLNIEQIIGVLHIASTDWKRVKLVDYNVVRHRHEHESAVGKPSMVAVDGDNLVVYPTPDANYTLTVQTWELLDQTGWTIGGDDATTLAVELNVPDRWIDDVLWWGARAYMLLGAPGHPDASASMSEFSRVVIPKARGEGTKSIGPTPRYNNSPYGLDWEITN